MPLSSASAPERPRAEIELTAVLNPVFFENYAALAREIFRALSVSTR